MNYHFIGIGGIGMSALAKILHGKGARVQGSDGAASYVTEELESIGVKVFPSHDETHVSSSSTVIYGSAIKSHHPEYVAATTQKLPLLHRSELLAKLLEGHETLLITGTHGKTTTSSLVSHVLMESGLDPTFALGGIALNTKTNGRVGKGQFFVAEADESDGSFLNYTGHSAIITNIEEDHLDYWKTKEALVEGFKTFANRISKYLWWCIDECGLTLPGKSYGFSTDADLQITAWEQKGWHLVFDLKQGQNRYSQIEIPLLGRHNVLNATAVFGLCLELGVSEENIRSAFKTFKGVKRRMEQKGENRGIKVFDDYAHHPTEIETTLKGLRQAAGEKRVIALFQPHRFSRLKDCWDGFLNAFEPADVVFMTDVYAAGEKPIDGISAEKLYQELKQKLPIPVFFAPRDQLLRAVGEFARPHDVLITLGAGDVTYLSDELVDYPFKPFRLIVLQGGRSAEHEVALLSSKMVTEALDSNFYDFERWTISKDGEWMNEGVKTSLPDVTQEILKADLVYPILHGPFGEDGMIQGFLETLGIPYVGCDFRACALTMDKAWTKRVVQTYGIRVARFVEFSVHNWIKRPHEVREKILKEFKFPFYIKATHLGSTFGVHRVNQPSEIDGAIDSISKLDYKFLVEDEVKGRELEFGFIGDDLVDVSDAAEVVRSEVIHTYVNKYCASGNPSIPKASLPPGVLEEGRAIAETVYRAVGCSGLARIDFFLDSNNQWILNEVNPMPGCTPMSVYPAIWKAEGVTMREVYTRVIIASLHRYRSQQRHLRPPEKPPIEL